MTCQHLVSCNNPAAEGSKKCQWHLDQIAEYAKGWREKNAAKINARRREMYAEAARDRIGVWTRNSVRYGLTRDDYLRMLDERNRLCDICHKPETSLGNNGRIKNLSIDHDHDTGEVRGLLCNNCNRSLGLLGDSIELLQSAIDYLRRAEGLA